MPSCLGSTAVVQSQPELALRSVLASRSPSGRVRSPPESPYLRAPGPQAARRARHPRHHATTVACPHHRLLLFAEVPPVRGDRRSCAWAAASHRQALGSPRAGRPRLGCGQPPPVLDTARTRPASSRIRIRIRLRLPWASPRAPTAHARGLVSCAGDSLTICSERIEDLVGGLGPHKRPWVLVPGPDPRPDVSLQGLHALVD